MWNIEDELDCATKKKEESKKYHRDLANQNQDLNNQIDDCLVEVMEMEEVNKILQQQIEKYMFADEQARVLLDRRHKMKELLDQVGTKLEITGNPIAHLR